MSWFMCVIHWIKREPPSVTLAMIQATSKYAAALIFGLSTLKGVQDV